MEKGNTNRVDPELIKTIIINELHLAAFSLYKEIEMSNNESAKEEYESKLVDCCKQYILKKYHTDIDKYDDNVKDFLSAKCAEKEMSFDSMASTAKEIATDPILEGLFMHPMSLGLVHKLRVGAEKENKKNNKKK